MPDCVIVATNETEQTIVASVETQATIVADYVECQ